MKKYEKRYHKAIDNKVASVYIDEVFLPKERVFDDGTETMTICYYEYIGICVSNNKRFNNDWWNGDKKGNAIYNKSTGNIKSILAIADMLSIHIDNSIATYGNYCCMLEPTDTHRRKAYMRMIKNYCNKRNLDYYYVIIDTNTLLYWISK